MSGSRRSFLGRVASLPVGRVTASWHGGCGSPRESKLLGTSARKPLNTRGGDGHVAHSY